MNTVQSQEELFLIEEINDMVTSEPVVTITIDDVKDMQTN